MRKGRGTCAESRGGPRAGATAAGGCRAGELRNPYSRLCRMSLFGCAAKQASCCRWLPGPGVLETIAASPCRGWSRRARRCSFRPAPGPEVRRRHRPAAVSTGRSRPSGPLVRAASGQVSGSRPRGASSSRICPSCCATASGAYGRRGRRLAERRRLGSRPCAVSVLANPCRARSPDLVHRACDIR